MDKQKHYEQAVFKYALANGVNSSNSEKEFLKFLEEEKPTSDDDYSRINKKNVLSQIIEGASIYKANKIKGPARNVKIFNTVYKVVFYIYFLIKLIKPELLNINSNFLILGLFMLNLLFNAMVKDAVKKQRISLIEPIKNKAFEDFKGADNTLTVREFLHQEVILNKSFYLPLINTANIQNKKSSSFFYKSLKRLSLIIRTFLLVSLFIPSIFKIKNIDMVFFYLVIISISIHLILSIIDYCLDMQIRRK